jgi:Sec-independent protein secretion pathway component TatC
MAIMGAPMYVLYEICIFISGFIEKKRKNDETTVATKA